MGPPLGAPIVAYGVIVALVAIARFAIYRGSDVPSPILMLSAADASSLAYTASPLALFLPYYLHIPIVAPPTPGRRGAGTVLRTAVAVLAALWGTFIILDVPSATSAMRIYSA